MKNVMGLGLALIGLSGCVMVDSHPAPAVDEYFEVVSIPPGADIHFEDGYRGKAPLQRIMTAPGSWRVTAKLPGYETGTVTGEGHSYRQDSSQRYAIVRQSDNNTKIVFALPTARPHLAAVPEFVEPEPDGRPDRPLSRLEAARQRQQDLERWEAKQRREQQAREEAQRLRAKQVHHQALPPPVIEPKNDKEELARRELERKRLEKELLDKELEE